MFVFDSYPIYYIAKNYEGGLVDVILLARRPDGVTEGVFNMIEYDPTGPQKGIYVYDYLPKMEGEYLFSVFQGGTHKFSKSEFFELRPEERPIIKFD